MFKSAWRGKRLGLQGYSKRERSKCTCRKKTVEPPKIETPTPTPPVETPPPEQEPVKAPEEKGEKGGICGPTTLPGIALLPLGLLSVLRRRR
jgi:hypothetical protein